MALVKVSMLLCLSVFLCLCVAYSLKMTPMTMKSASQISQRYFLPSFELTAQNLCKSRANSRFFDFLKSDSVMELKNVTFSTEGSGPFALVGTPDSGRSSFIHILSGKENADEGSLNVNLDSVRDIIFFDPYYASFDKSKTVEKNILKALTNGGGLSSQRFDCYLHLIKTLDLFHVQSALPSSLLTRDFYSFLFAMKLAESANNRSKTFAPPVVVIDGWLGRSDNFIQSPLCQLLQELAQEGAPKGLRLPVLIATSNVLMAATTASQAIVFSDGKLLEACPPDDSAYIMQELYIANQKPYIFGEGVSREEAAKVEKSPAPLEPISLLPFVSKEFAHPSMLTGFS